MVIINKGVKGHNSQNMINKVIDFIAEGEIPVNPKNVKVVKVWTKNGQREYQRYYRDLKGNERQRRDLGLHVKDFKNHTSYMRAYADECKHKDNEKLKDFIEEQVNGGMVWGDEPCVLL